MHMWQCVYLVPAWTDSSRSVINLLVCDILFVVVRGLLAQRKQPAIITAAIPD